MRYRSVKSWFLATVSALAFWCAVVPEARATMVVQSLSKGLTVAGTTYYGYTDGGATAGTNFPSAPLDTTSTAGFSFELVNTNKYYAPQVTADALADPDQDDLLYFSVYSDHVGTLNTTAGQTYVISVSVVNPSGGASPDALAPVTYPCLDTGVGCLAPVSMNLGGLSQNRSLGALYSQNQTLTIALSAREICSVASQTLTNLQSYGCPTTGTYSAPVPTATAGQRLALRFTLQVLPNAASSPVAYSTSADTSVVVDSFLMNLNFQLTSPTMPACNIDGTGNIYYQPGDSSILLDTGQFQFLAAALAAPETSVLLAFFDHGPSNPAAVPVLSQIDSGAYTVRHYDPSGTQRVDGLQNSTANDTHFYGLGAVTRDAAGLLAIPPALPAPGCTHGDVEVAEIRGFLSRSQCFIATAAFNSMDAAPVAMLRDFRDEVLLHFGPGRAFVHWYYHWSPGAADWMLSHPGARVPVLLALVPLECLAWLVLHPLIWLLLSIIGAGAAWLVSRGADAPRGAAVSR